METGWAEHLVNDTQAGHPTLPEQMTSTVADLLSGEMSAGALTAKRLGEVATSILYALASEEEAEDADQTD